MEYVVETRQIPEQAVICIRGRIAQTEIPAFMQRSFAELFAHLGRLGAAPAGPPIAIYHAFEPHDVDTEICVPVVARMEPATEIGSRLLPACTVARTTHVGPYEGLVAAYAAVTDWIRNSDWQTAGPVRERYLNGPGDSTPPDDYRTEVEIPIEPALVGAHL